MRTKFVETVQDIDAGFNHGKFMVARFDDEEWGRPSEVDLNHDSFHRSLIGRCGWTADHVLVLDLQTGEGAVFLPGGMPKADLDKHRVWVCPMFEPFLEWLYARAGSRTGLASEDWFENLPTLVELPNAPASMAGYRRGEDAAAFEHYDDPENREPAPGAPVKLT